MLAFSLILALGPWTQGPSPDLPVPMEGWRVERVPHFIELFSIASLRTQFAEDEFGRRFYLTADHGLWHQPIADRYLQRSPLHRPHVALQSVSQTAMEEPNSWREFGQSCNGRAGDLIGALPSTDENQVSLMYFERGQRQITLFDISFEEGGPILADDSRVFAKWDSALPSADWVHVDRHGEIYFFFCECRFWRIDREHRVFDDERVYGRPFTPVTPTERLLASLASPSPHEKAKGLRWFEPHLSHASEDVFFAILANLEHGGEAYARQVACSFGEIADTERGINALCSLLLERGEDPWLRFAARSGLEGRELHLLEKLIGTEAFEHAKMGRYETVTELARDILLSGRRTEVRRLIDISMWVNSPRSHMPYWQAKAIAEAFGVADEDDIFESLRAIRKKSEFKSSDLEQQFDKGQKLYETSCMECHRPSGFGSQKRYPERRVFATDTGLDGLREILADSNHEGVEPLKDLMELINYLRHEWKPLTN